MIYEKYRAKIEKLAKGFKIIKRFRVLIIAVLLFVATLTTTLLATRGVIVSEGAPKQTSVEYGESFTYDASAFMSDISYEYYYTDSKKWSTEKPTSVGEYKIRVYTKGTFGIKRYGKAHSFSITAKNSVLKITDEKVTYGDALGVSADLIAGDEIRSIDFAYEGVNGNLTDKITATPIVTTVQVFNKAGENVSGFYHFTAESKEIQFTARRITVSTESDSKTYDGQALKNEKATITQNTLASGDELIAENFASALKGGDSVKNTANFRVQNEQWGNVSNYYTITPDWGTLSISKREIIVVSATASKEYDGEKLTAEDTESIVGTPADGEELEIKYQGQQIDVGSSKNLFSVEVKKIGSETDYTSDNYKITETPGTLSVSKRKIKFLSESAERSYDGTPLTRHEADVVVDEQNGYKALAKGDSVDYTFTGTITQALVKDGKVVGVQNTYTVAISSPRGNAYDNYEPTLLCGELKILTVGLGFSTLSGGKVYDGTPFSLDGYTITKGQLFEGDSIVFTGLKSVWRKGVSDNTVESFKILTKTGEDATQSYTLLEEDILWGKLEIYAREVYLISVPAEKIYDGKPLTSNKAEISDYVYYEAALAKGHTVQTQFTGSQTNVGSSLNGYDNAKVVFTFNGEDVSDCFDICDFAAGDLLVKPRQIKVKTADCTWYYDGVCHYDNDGKTHAYTKARALPAQGDYLTLLTELGHEIRVIEGTGNTVLNVPYEGIIYENYALYEVVLNGDNGVNANYDISYEYGTLTILPREITVQSDSSAKIYDGTVLTANGCDLTADSPFDLVSGHYLYGYDYYAELVGVGTHNNTFEVVVEADDYSTVDWDYDALRRNYNITKKFGTLEIVHRRIVVKMQDRVWDYDGVEHYDDSYYDNDDLVVDNTGISNPLEKYQYLVDEQYLALNWDKYDSLNKIIDFGTIENNLFDCFIIYDRWGEDVTDNYLLYKYEDRSGSLTVNKIKIYVQTHTHDDWVFDGTFQHDTCEYGNWDLQYPTDEFRDIPYTDYLEVDSYTEIKYVGEKENVLSFKVFAERNGRKTETTQNYDIYTGEYEGTGFANGTLKINPRPLVIRSYSAEETYNGQPLTAEGYDLLLGTSLADGHFLEITFTQSPINAGTYQNEFAYKIVDENGKEYDELFDEYYADNYTIYTVFGTLTILKREITVKASSWSGVYDGTEHILLAGSYTLPVGSLADGEVLSVQTSGVSEIDVRVGGYVHEIYDGSAEVKKQTADGIIPTTDNYDITYQDGLLLIQTRTLYLTVHEHSKIYDGTALSCATDCTYTDEDLWKGEKDGNTYYPLVEGHTFEVLSYATITGVGEIQNYVDLRILEADGTPTWTDNYSVKYQEGKNLKISHRTIKVITHTHEHWTYDAMEHSCYEIGCEYSASDMLLVDNVYYTLVDGHSLVVDAYEGIVNVAENGKKNAVSFLICDEFGEYYNEDSGLYSNNYIIELEKGSLSVQKRALFITTQSQEWVYDGEEHYQKSVDDFLDEGASYENIMSEAVIYTNRDLTVGEMDGKEYYSLAHLTHLILISSRDESTTIKDVPEDGAEPVWNILTFQVVAMDENMEVDLSVNRNYEITVSDEYGVLSITPRDLAFTTKSAEKIYDGTPLISHEIEYLNGTTIAKGQSLDITYTGSQTNGYDPLDEDLPYGQSENTFVLNGVLDKEGNPVATRNYNIYETLTGVLTVYKREISIVADSLERIYNGEEWVIEPNSYTVKAVSNVQNAMADGQVLTVHTTGARAINAGTYYNEITDWKISAENIPDVEKNYIVGETTGALVINRRTIAVKMHYHEKIYDGKEFSCRVLGCEYTEKDLYINNTTTFGLVEGHSLSLVKAPTITDAERVLNEVEIAVVGAGAEGNYEVSFANYEDLVIRPRPLLVRLHTHTKVYDGSELSCEALGCEYTERDLVIDNENYFGLVNGDRLTYQDCAYATYVAENKANSVALFVEDNWYNYEIFYEEDVGELVITPRNIWVKATHDLTFTYDGKVHYDGDGKVISKYTDADLNILTQDGILYDSLVAGDTLSVDPNLATRITNVWEGEVANKVGFKVANSKRKQITSSYNIRLDEEDYGTLRVEKRKIRIQAISESYEYDKQSREILGGVYANNFIYLRNQDGKVQEVCKGQELQVEISGAKVEFFGKAINYLYPETVKIVFTTTGSDTKDDFNGHTLLENYEIENLQDWFNEADSHGLLEIYARKITVHTGSVYETYDGNTYYDPTVYSKYTEGVISGSGILAGQEIRLANEENRNFITDVGSFNNTLTKDDFAIWDDEFGDVTPYYEINVKRGKLQIVPRRVYIVTHTHHFGEYDGENHSCETDDAECQGVYTEEDMPLEMIDGEQYFPLVAGHTLSIYKPYSIKNAGTVENKLVIEILDENGNSMTNRGSGLQSNYLIEYSYGTLTLDKRVLDIKTNGKEKVYDGTYLYFEDDDTNGYEIVNGTVANDQYLHIYFTGRQLDAYMIDDVTADGVSKNTFTWSVTDRWEIEPYTDNYIVNTLSLGDLVVTKRPISIVSDDEYKDYDGTELRGDSLTAIGLLESEVVDMTFTSSQTNVGSCRNEYTYDILRNGWTESSYYNYTHTTDYGTLTVGKREIKLRAKTLNPVPYKAEAYEIYAGEWEFAEDSKYDTFALDHVEYFHIATTGARGTEIGEYENRVTGTPYFIGGISMDNYDISVEDGVLHIIKRKILVVEHDYQTHTHLDKYYDGEPISCKDCVYTQEDLYIDYDEYFDLLAGHSLHLVDYTEVIGASVVRNEIVVEVVGDNAEGKYEIVYNQSGYIRVKARPIKLITNDYTSVYNGLEQYDPYEYGNADADKYAGTTMDETVFMTVLEGHTLYAVNKTRIVNVWDSGIENEIEFRIQTVDGTDVTKNYDYINYIEYGTLTLTARKIKVQLHDCEWVYDGQEHYEGDKQEISSMPYGEYDLIAGAGYYTTLGEGDWFKIDYEKPYATILADALLKQTENYLELKVLRGDTNEPSNVSNNYEIEYVSGTLKIAKSNIVIKPYTYSKAFDGTGIETQAGDYTVDGKLIGDHRIIIDSPVYTLGAFDVDNVSYFEFTDEEKASVQIVDGAGNDVSGYYNYTFGTGYLWIYKLDLYIAPQSLVKTYDGKDLKTEAGKYEVRYGQIPSIYTIEISSGEFILDAEILDTEMEIFFSDEEKASLIVRDLDGNIVDDYSAYMDIYFESGSLLIKKIKVGAESDSAEKDYDGKPLTMTTFKKYVVYGKIPEGHEFYCEVVGTITDPGKVKNTIAYWVKDSEGNFVTDKYYVFDVAEGTLTVNVRNSNSELYIKPEDILRHSDEALSGTAYADFSPTKTTYKTGDKYGIIDTEGTSTLASMIKHWGYTYEATIRTVGTTREILSFTLYNEKGEDVTDLFQILTWKGRYETYTGEFIFIDVAEISKTYDGGSLRIDSSAFTVRCVFLYDTSLSIRFKGLDIKVAEAGRLTDEILLNSVVIMNADGENVTEQYRDVISFSERRPIVYKRVVTAEVKADGTIVQTGGSLLSGDRLAFNERKQVSVMRLATDVRGNYLLFVKE